MKKTPSGGIKPSKEETSNSSDDKSSDRVTTPPVSNEPVIESLSKISGSSGGFITINGNGFSNNKNELEVVFKGSGQGKMIAPIVDSSDMHIQVIVPGLIGEQTNVTVKARNKVSNTKKFTITALLDPTVDDHGNETREVITVVDDVVKQTLHELNIGLIPFLQSNNLSAEASELEKQLTELNAYTTNALSGVLNDLTDEELSRMDAVFTSESVQEQLERLKFTAEVLSHSTTGEAIDNINQAIDALENTLDVLREIKFWLEATIGILSVAVVASLGSAAPELGPVISILEVILDDVIKPIIIVLEVIYELLNLAPTEAVGGSFATQNYGDSLGINQYFGSMKKPQTENPGIIYLNQPYYLEGSIDYATNDNRRNLENMKTDLTGGTLVTILDYVGALPDFDFDVSGVEVKLGADSSDPEIVSTEWNESEDKLKIIPHKLGEVSLTIYADIAQIGNEIDKDDLSITRRFKVISGDESTPPYTMGARVDTVINSSMTEKYDDLTAYIGDTLSFAGEGFSTSHHHQKVNFESVAGYNDTGTSKHVNGTYTSFDLEVPDTVSGDLNVTVGNWPSNDIAINILEPKLTRVASSAIIGETWPIKGEGFSHTLENNEANFNGLKVFPFKTIDAHPDHHKTLSFKVPSSANSGAFSITTIGELISNKVNVIVRAFTSKIIISNKNRDALRPAVAYDDATGNKIVVYVDKNDDNGNQLLATIEDDNAFQETFVVSDTVGGLNVAPSIPCVTAANNQYFVAWAEQVDGTDVIYFRYSIDGSQWNEKMAVSNASVTSHSYEPDIEVSDIDKDGDLDVLVSWTEEGITTEDNAIVRLAVLENEDNTTFKIHGEYDITNRVHDSNAPDLGVYGDNIAIAYSKDYGSSLEEYRRDIYVQRMETSGLHLTKGTLVNISKNEGGYLKEKYVTPLIEAEGIFRIAENPSIDIDDNNNVYVAYENTLKTFKEDVFYAKLLSSNDIAHMTNITNSDYHSQSPKVNLDADMILSIAYMEQGFETGIGFNNDRSDAFESQIVFARSFNYGETFNEPYMQLQKDNTGNRIGHLAMDTSGDGEIAIVWQSEEDSHPTINMRTTSGDISPPSRYSENSVKSNSGDYILRTQSNEKFLNDYLPDPKTWVHGDLYITNMDGTGVRRITRKASIYGRASANLSVEKSVFRKQLVKHIRTRWCSSYGCMEKRYTTGCLLL